MTPCRICGKPGTHRARVGQVLCHECNQIDLMVNRETNVLLKEQMRANRQGTIAVARYRRKVSA